MFGGRPLKKWLPGMWTRRFPALVWEGLVHEPGAEAHMSHKTGRWGCVLEAFLRGWARQVPVPLRGAPRTAELRISHTPSATQGQPGWRRRDSRDGDGSLAKLRLGPKLQEAPHSPPKRDSERAASRSAGAVETRQRSKRSKLRVAETPSLSLSDWVFPARQ